MEKCICSSECHLLVVSEELCILTNFTRLISQPFDSCSGQDRPCFFSKERDSLANNGKEKIAIRIFHRLRLPSSLSVYGSKLRSNLSYLDKLRDGPFDIQGGLGFFLATSYFFLSFCTTSYFLQEKTATNFLFFEK